MNRWIVLVVGLALGAGLWYIPARTGHAQGGGQSVPGDPYATPANKPGNVFLQGSGAAPAPPNADIAVKPSDGEWMINVMVYRGPEAHQMARQFVSVLRSKQFNLWAFVHDYSAEARKVQEDLRRERIERYKANILAQGQPLPKEILLKMPKIEVQDEVAVLIGGYKDQQTAHAALDEIKKKLPMPDEKLVKLDKAFATTVKKDGHTQDWEEVPVNPFKRATMVRNPSLPKKAPQTQEWDLSLLQALNADESYSLLKCPKKITLVVKEFRLPVTIETADSMNLKVGGSGLAAAEPKDTALYNAHTLAEILRQQGKLDAYVLHDRKCSLVTVGGFDSLNDPAMPTVQKRIADIAKYFASHSQNPFPALDPLVIMPVGIPMKVPH